MGRRGAMPAAKFYGFLIVTAVLAASAAAKVVHSIPKQQLRRRYPSSKSPAFGSTHRQSIPALTRSEQRGYLNAHNDIRESLDIPPLSWDPKLAAAAQSWAEKRRGDCAYRTHSNTPYGENIFFMDYREFTPKEVVDWWYKENTNYDAANHQCKCWPEREGCECGHYLNIVWKDTERVGCSSVVYCDNQKGVIVVCEYDPPGLVSGVDPFTGEQLTEDF